LGESKSSNMHNRIIGPPKDPRALANAIMQF